MTASERPDEEPEAPTHTGPSIAPKGRQAFARVRRELSDDELATPAVPRFLMDDVERLERENTELREYRNRYHAKQERVILLEERARKSLSGEIVFGGLSTVAGAAIGYAPSIWIDQPTATLVLIFGFVVLVVGISARVVQK